MRPKLYTAGPVTVPQSIQQELSQPILYHRESEFLEIFYSVISGMKYIFQTENDVLPFIASGTGGMEAAILNLFSPGDQVLVLDQGKFSARWVEICQCHRLQVERIEFSWRESIDKRQLKKAVKSMTSLKGVFFNHCETSTGALNDIQKAAEIVHRHSKALVIVDAISTIGVIPFKMDEWNIDVVITASNKGLQNPPGLVFVALNETAWNFVQCSDLSTYYFSFKKAKHAMEKGIGSAFTPAISLFYGVQQAIKEIQQKSIDAVWEEHKKLAQTFRKTVKYLGLNIWPHNPSDSLTMIEIPREFQANKIIAQVKNKYGFILSKGQGILSNKVIRIGHLENVNPETDAKLLTALEDVLKTTGIILAHTNSSDYFLKKFHSR